MPAASFYAQINFYTAASLDAVSASVIGLGAKSDGLYAKTSVGESRLLVVADIGVNVAAFVHTHNYDNYQSWDCKVGLTTTHITSGYTLEHYAGTGITLAVSNPSQNVSRITHAISDDVVRKSGTPVQYCIPVFSNENTLVATNALQYDYSQRKLMLGYPAANSSTSFEMYCHYNLGSASNHISAFRTNANEAILSGFVLLKLLASGCYDTGIARLTGEIAFTAENDFSSSESATIYSLKTHGSGVNAYLQTRHLITGTGLTRIAGGLIAGTIASDPTSILETTGSFGAAILSTIGTLTLNETHFTVIISATSAVTLPTASTVPGRIYIIANKSGGTRTINPGYINLGGSTVTTLSNSASIIVQSNGTVWHQIN
jgi:hypothetical protein